MDLSRPGLPKPDAVLLRMQLIGRMQAVTLNNESVLPLGRKTRGLLAILAMSGRRPVLRSRLAELLWSRRSEEQARASLRQEIHRLLDALSPVGADLVTVERHTLALKPALTSVDAERVLNANANQAETLPPIEGVLLDELTGTDPALDGWLQIERNRLRQHATLLFEGLLQRQRDLPGVLATTRQLLLLDGLHEQAWRAQIQAYLVLGENGLALQSAERCAAAFAERNGAEPGAETRRLLAELSRAPPGTLQGARQDMYAGMPQGTPPGTSLGPDAADPVADASMPFLPDRAEQAAALPATAATHQQDDVVAHAGPDRVVPLAEVGPPLRREQPGGVPRVAVLPLLDLDGGDGDRGVLTRGLADNLGVGLMQYGRLRLVGGSELHDTLAQGRDDPLLRRRFGLDYVLDGTVQRGGGRVRVILRLTDIRQHGQIVWAQRFDAPHGAAAAGAPGDLLALQDTVTMYVSARLPWEIMLVEARRLRHRPVAELDPFGMVMRCIGLVLTGDRLQNDRACAILAEHPGTDPHDALPALAAAAAHLMRCLQRWGDPQREAALARQHACLAVEREPTRHAAPILRGLIRSELEDEPEQALALLDRTLELFPHSAAGWAASSFPLVRLGRLDEAARRSARYKALFPTHPLELLLDRPGIMIPLLAGRFEEAAQLGAAAVELRPGFAPNLVPYLSALGHLRRAGEADRIRGRLEATLPRCDVESLVAAAGLRDPAHRERLADGLRQAGLSERAADRAGARAAASAA